jgi:predicted esterase
MRILLLSIVSLAAASALSVACAAEPVGTLRRSPAGADPTDQDPGDGTTTSPDGGGPSVPKADGGAGPEDSGGGGAANGTKGSGGPTGDNELTSAASGLRYKINAPAPGSAPRGLLVLLHGSTASNYASFVSMMANVAAQYDLIRVSVLAPNGQGWNEGGQQAQSQAADKLHALIQQDLFPKYDIDTSKIVFSGQSSGGGFLSSHFVPLHAKDYRGGAFFQCGAAPPAVTFAPDAQTKSAFRLHFEITSGDSIWPDSYARAVTAYTQAGMTLTKDNTKSGGHCAFDQQAVIVAHIKAVLGLP